jgi:hypothetical protein
MQVCKSGLATAIVSFARADRRTHVLLGYMARADGRTLELVYMARLWSRNYVEGA